MRLCRGYHLCEFCLGAKWRDRYFRSMGNGEIRVRNLDGTWYVAPRLFSTTSWSTTIARRRPLTTRMSPSEIGSDGLLRPRYTQQIESSCDVERRMRNEFGPPFEDAEFDRVMQEWKLGPRPKRPW